MLSCSRISFFALFSPRFCKIPIYTYAISQELSKDRKRGYLWVTFIFCHEHSNILTFAWFAYTQEQIEHNQAMIALAAIVFLEHVYEPV